jgi:hypothetical protein
VNGSAGASGIDPNGATPAEVRQAVNAVGLATTGAGITVGVMSDSFNYLGGAAADEAIGALPPASQVHVLKDLPNPNTPAGTDEGRAMMQIAHDVAPGANLDFYTASGTAQDFADGIIALANAGCSVICDDETFYDEPFYQTDVVANAIQTVEQQGVIYVTCAGNQASAAYQSGWSNIASTTYGGQTLTNTLNFGTAASPNPVQSVKIRSGASPDPTPLLVEWNQPFGNITSSLAVVVFRDGSYVGTFDNNGSGNPFIRVNLSSGHTYQIAIEVESGPAPSLVKDEIFNDADAAAVTMDGANAGTVYGHHMSPYAITVGAVNSADTPGNGGTLSSEPFSSSGAGTQLWFNYDGSAVANGPLSLSPVAISGVDHINTTVSDIQDFFGTSAATPSVAAVIANMLQVNAGLPFALIKQILQQTALPFGDSQVAGAGLVDALAAVNAAMPNSPPAGTTANMVLSNSAGVYEIYNLGGDSMLAAYQLGQVGPNWGFVTLGGFFGSDTSDMLLRDSSTGGFEVYDISNNQIIGAAFMGAVGLDWQFSGVGNFNGVPGETDLLLRNSTTGGLEVYDINNNQLIGAAFLGTVGSNWQFSGIGNFSGRGESDLLLRNANTGGLEVYDIANNAITGAAVIGPIGSDWQFSGVGNFSGVPGESDLLLRNVNTGGLEVYDINNNQLIGAAFIGTVGLDWQFAGVAPANGPGTSDLVLRNVTTGQFEVYDIAGNQLTGAASFSAGTNWQLGGFAANAPTASAAAMGSSSQIGQLVQAMAGFGGSSGAAEGPSAAPLGADTSQQPLLTTPHSPA